MSQPRPVAVIVPILALALALPILAGPREDLRIEEKQDEKRNTVYRLVNHGDKPILAKVKYEKECSGVSNTQKPVVRDYYVRPGQSIQLGKAWSRTTCSREYRVTEARYR